MSRFSSQLTRRRRPFHPPHSIGARGIASAVAASVLWGGCALLPRSQPASPPGAFAAHPGYRGLIVDRMGDGQTAILAHAQSSLSGATHLLRADGQIIAAFWLADHDHITARQAPDLRAPLLGEVGASWKQGAIQLAFQLQNGASFHTTRFHRIDREDFPDILDRELFQVSYLPGVFRAELRDAADAPVGWFTVRILPYQGLPREYQADLPSALNGPMAAGAVELVDSEIASIIDRNALPEDRIPEGLAP